MLLIMEWKVINLTIPKLNVTNHGNTLWTNKRCQVERIYLQTLTFTTANTHNKEKIFVSHRKMGRKMNREIVKDMNRQFARGELLTVGETSKLTSNQDTKTKTRRHFASITLSNTRTLAKHKETERLMHFWGF